MVFAWDRVKSAANLRRRGLDFEFAARIFAGKTVEREDLRREYGEPERFVAIGEALGLVLTVVYTDRSTDDGTVVRRIISARRSNSRERETYRSAG